MQAPTPKTVTLAGKAAKVDKQLVVKYQLTNGRAQPVYVFDLMIDYNDSGQIINRDLAYVFWEEPATLRLVRAALRLPPDRDLTKKEVPYVREVRPGGLIEGQIVLALPADEYSPFYPPVTAPEDVKEVACSTVRLLLGWTELKEGMKLVPRDAGEPVLAVKGAWSGPYQELVEQAWQLPVNVKVRKTPFDRRLPEP